MQQNMHPGALSDITVIDLTRVLSGPFATMWLGEMGANIIKVEIPNGGDEARKNPPFKDGGDLSTFFVTVNRNKRSITLNLKSDEGKALFKELVKKADVVVENFRPDVMDRLGLGYEDLRQVNDRLIYCSISGFGSFGPYTKRPAYDVISQAMGGIMSITGEEGGDPLKVGASIGDITGGMNAVIGILAALHARTITGKGQRVETALVDSIIAVQQAENNRYFVTGNTTPRTGNRYPANCPYGTYHAKDGVFMIGVGKDELFVKLCEQVLNCPDVPKDERFCCIAQRAIHYKEIRELLEGWAKDYTVNEVVDKLLAAGVPAGPIMSIADISKDPHFAGARNLFPTMEQPGLGEFTVTAMPIKFSETETYVHRPAPMLGQHNEEVYAELAGLTAEQLAHLKEHGTI